LTQTFSLDVVRKKKNFKIEILEKRRDYLSFFFFSGAGLAAGAGSGAGGIGSSGFISSFFSSISVVISSIGFGGGVVAIVHPIHAPINSIATKATSTGTAMSQYLTLDKEPTFSQG